MQKLFSQACDNNKLALLNVLQQQLSKPGSVLEIGSGTGQHAVFFASHLPHLQWQTSDLAQNHPSIQAWIADYTGENVQPPVALDVNQHDWGFDQLEAIFTANTAHIMAWDEVLQMLSGSAQALVPGGKLVIYGPFNYGGEFTSDSNARFNDWLQQQAPHRAIRDFESVCKAAAAHALVLAEDYEMPANNRCLVFIKS